MHCRCCDYCCVAQAIRVYQTYINMMNHHIRQQMDVANPFKFKHITNLKVTHTTYYILATLHDCPYQCTLPVVYEFFRSDTRQASQHMACKSYSLMFWLHYQAYCMCFTITHICLNYLPLTASLISLLCIIDHETPQLSLHTLY
jgi:hypothetical protein